MPVPRLATSSLLTTDIPTQTNSVSTVTDSSRTAVAGPLASCLDETRVNYGVGSLLPANKHESVREGP